MTKSPKTVSEALPGLTDLESSELRARVRTARKEKSEQIKQKLFSEALQTRWHQHILEVGNQAAIKQQLINQTKQRIGNPSLATVALLDLQIDELRKELSKLIVDEGRRFVDLLHDEIRKLQLETSDNNFRLSEEQRQFLDHQFMWFRQDFTAEIEAKFDLKSNEIRALTEADTKEALANFRDFMVEENNRKMAEIKHQLTMKIDMDTEASRALLMQYCAEEIKNVEAKWKRDKEAYESEQLQDVKRRIEALESILDRERKEKLEIEKDFLRLQREFQKFLLNHPSDKYSPDFMMLERRHLKLENFSDNNS